MSTLTRARGLALPPEGFAETMNTAEFDIIYPALPEEVHKTVDAILERENDKPIYCFHGKVDTPTLVLGAIKTHVGRTLPKMDQMFRVRDDEIAEDIGTTREITEEDLFVVSEVRDDGWPALLTILERA